MFFLLINEEHERNDLLWFSWYRHLYPQRDIHLATQIHYKGHQSADGLLKPNL